jgi:D-alanine-D-alanine ligase
MVADYLEKADFTFTGAASDVLAKAQDKKLIKRLLDDNGISTPLWQLYDTDSPVNWDRFPAIVKPSMEHCSEGIDRNAVCENKAELLNRIRYVIDRFQQPALVEDFIDGRELHVSLWGNGRIEMLPPAEMEFSMLTDCREHLCGYEAKFVPDSIQYQNIKTILPAPLTEQERFSIELACKSAYRVTGCRDYARIDMRIKDGIFYIIDVNPNSDISPDTSTILAAGIEGYNYEKFLDRIVRLAAHRHHIWGR